jgi:hypothetical protein
MKHLIKRYAEPKKNKKTRYDILDVVSESLDSMENEEKSECNMSDVSTTYTGATENKEEFSQLKKAIEDNEIKNMIKCLKKHGRFNDMVAKFYHKLSNSVKCPYVVGKYKIFRKGKIYAYNFGGYGMYVDLCLCNDDMFDNHKYCNLYCNNMVNSYSGFKVSFIIKKATADKNYNKTCCHNIYDSKLYKGWLEYEINKDDHVQYLTYEYSGTTEYSGIIKHDDIIICDKNDYRERDMCGRIIYVLDI